MKKKKTKTIWPFIGIAVLLIGVSQLSKITVPDSSEPSDSQPEEIPTFNIGDHDRHIFEAVNDTIILTATVMPENADDKTLVWTSSDQTSVAIISTTATTATIKCLKAFTESVTITVRATNGTPETTDDFLATCVCSFYVAVESIDLQLWEVSLNSETHEIETYVTHVTNTFDLPVAVSVYAFKVVVLPTTATNKNFLVESSILENDEGACAYGLITDAYSGQNDNYFSDVVGLTNWTNSMFLRPFKFGDVTNPEKLWNIDISAADNAAITDSMSISVGNHYKSSNKSYFTPVIKINSDTTPLIQTIDQLEFRFMDEEQIQNPLNVGSCVKFEFSPNGFVEPQLTLTYDADVFQITTLTGGAVDNADGTITVSMTEVASIELLSLVSTGSTYPTYVSIKPAAYSSVYAVEIPFVFKQFVSGLSLDTTTATF